MREINLNGVFYEIKGETTHRAINPWKAQVRSAGGSTYSDFSQAEPEEYHDFRNGIGKNRGVGSDARLQWSEGIDFSIEGQAVLAPLVNTVDYATWTASTAYTAGAASALFSFVIPTTPNTYCYECTTAGTSHTVEPVTWGTTPGGTTSEGGGTVVWTCRNYLAPIKIIDFQDYTYIIQNSRILKWDKTNSVLTCVDNTFASPIDAIVVTDGTDEYLIVSSATAALYTVDGTTWDNLMQWVTPTSHSDADSVWDNEANAYDDSTSTSASTVLVANDAWGSYLELIHAGVWCSSIRYYASDYSATHIDKIDIDVYYGGAWHSVYQDVFTTDTWETKTITGGPFLVTKARVRFYNTHASEDPTANLKEFDFGLGAFGYLADYDNKLYFISTDGKGISYSTAKDIDAYSSAFGTAGSFGIVYGMFTGKLLADQTPALYFHANKGLFSLDITNEKYYKQEINYAPLTYAGHAGMYWNANIWVGTGAGIIKVAPSMATPVGPDQDDGLPDGYQGNIYDMLPVGNWLVYCVNGGSTDRSSILKRNASLGGNLQVYTTSAVNKAIACMWHSPSSLYTNGRLWFGEGTNVKYMMFPDFTSNVKQIDDYEYVNDSGYGKLPIFRKLAAIPKVAVSVAAITKSCDANEYVEVYYGLNGAAPTNLMGTFNDSPRDTIATFGSGLGTEFYTIQLAIKLIRGDTNTNSPELESLVFYWYGALDTINGWVVQILATGDKGEAIFTAFEAIRDTKTLVAFYPSGDTAKTSYNVKLTTMPSREWWENQGRKEGYFTVTLEEIFSG